MIGNFIKTKFLDVKIIKLLASQKTHNFKFENNTSYLSLNDNIKVRINEEKEQYILSEKDGLYFPAETSFYLENMNDYESSIIFCEGL